MTVGIQFPRPILSSLEEEYGKRWHRYFVLPSDRKRTQEEGIWRRTQTQENADESGWKNISDQRRRIVHYFHNFELLRCEKKADLNLVMTNSYLYYSLSLPRQEFEIEVDRAYKALQIGGWQPIISNDDKCVWKNGDLLCSVETFEFHPEDIRVKRKLPGDYRSVDIVIRTREIDNVQTRLPWVVLNEGMRRKEIRQKPVEVTDLSILKEFHPFHIEIGCGVSIEAGIPALNHLHDLYRVTDLDSGRFIFGGKQDDLVERLLRNPESEFLKLASLYSASFTAEPTVAHLAMRALQKAGFFIGPVMTNNFDGLAQRAGLTERFLRRYDESIPAIDFDERARALLVIGSHADRRRVQARARDRGLKVVFLDPEGYSVDGRFIPYPLEGPRNEDILCRKSASEGLKDLCLCLGINL